MWWWSRYTAVLILLSCIQIIGISQSCAIQLRGKIIDEGSREGLPYATVFIEETADGTAADEKGEFLLTGICPGAYHVRIDHVGCHSIQLFLEIDKDTAVVFTLHHHAELIDEVTIHGSSARSSTHSSQTIMVESLSKDANKNLGSLLEQIAGVSSLKNGSGIAKPIIHGLSGNRITLLNNGIAQAGQQWGNDHAPEIDPFVADHISVIKGASALAYGGTSLGSVVLIEPGSIPEEPHLHGNVRYIFDTNGGGHTLQAKMERAENSFAWRLKGSGKWFGDRKAADYCLTNTGNREGNMALQLDKDFGEKQKTSLYYSYFTTEIGILRGAHISNLTDLEEAIGRDVPLYTTAQFSYALDAPRQKVQHHLLKLEYSIFNTDASVLKFVSGTQYNNRKEYDIRRSGRSALPSLSIYQWDQFLESYYQRTISKYATWKTGIQFNLRDNTNDPETGVLPLIPDFRRFQYSVYSIWNLNKDQYGFEAGGRADLQDMEVLSISRTIPREIIRTDHRFYVFSLSAGGYVHLNPSLKARLNAGFVQRPPGINELYSIGLHQGVSGIEEGDPDLASERSLKFIASLQYKWRDKAFLEVLAFHQQVKDFIYLQVQPDYRLTVQGAFPVFLYEQTDARLRGIDVLYSYAPVQHLKWQGKFSYVQGRNIEEDLPLVNMPPMSTEQGIHWFLRSAYGLMDPSIKFSAQYVFRQKDYEEAQDLLAPPEGYLLTDVEWNSQVKIAGQRFRLFLGVNNLANVKYRNYLNRLRYFADDQGRNIMLGVQWIY